MKLYASAIVPFAARVTIASRVKGIAIEQLPLPAAGLRSPEFLRINPIGKVPVLITETGQIIAESEAILNYLEDRFATPSMWPVDPEQRAYLNVLVRVMETYVVSPITRLFPLIEGAGRDDLMVPQEFQRWNDGLAALAHFMRSPMPEVRAGVSLADCVLSTGLHLSHFIARRMNAETRVAMPPVLAAYYARVSGHSIVGPVLADMTTAQLARYGLDSASATPAT